MTPERIVQYSRADISDLKREDGESGGRRLETDTRSQLKLQIRNNNRRGTLGIQENEASSPEEDHWSPNTIRSVNQKILSTRQMKHNGPEFFHSPHW